MPLSEQYGRPTYRLAGAMYAIPFYSLVLLGLLRRRGGSMSLFLVLPALYFTVLHVASVGSVRYRMPAEPPLAGLAAAAASAART